MVVLGGISVKKNTCGFIEVENGVVNYYSGSGSIPGFYNGFLPGAKIYCKKGYNLIGRNDLKCVLEVAWSGRPPVCRGEFISKM